MSTRPSPKSSSDASLSEIASVLYRSLETALTRQCAQRYNTGIVLRCLAEASEDVPEMRIRVDCRGLTEMPVRLAVGHAGGNVYDVTCSVEGGDSHRFSYSVPGQSASRVACAPHLGEEIATFLRGELERRLGRILLQSPAAPPRFVNSTLS